MKFKGSAKFEWVAYREIGTEIYYAICDKEGQLATQSYKTLEEAKAALLNHFGIEVSQEAV